MPPLSGLQWVFALLAAIGVGFGKAGFFGVSIAPVLYYASVFGARDSTGVMLPMLIMGDVWAVTVFRRHAQWIYLKRMLPPACVGVVAGALMMRRMDNATFTPLIGWIVLGLTVLQVIRLRRPEWFSHLPQGAWFAWSMGLLAGVTTMFANAAGPVVALYSMAVGLPKLAFVGTNAWLFFIINIFKVPFSLWLGLIHGRTLAFNLAMAPMLPIGLFAGRWVMHRIPQAVFDGVVLVFAVIGAVRMIAGG